MKRLSAVFWDVDGTLADTEICGHRIAFNLAFKDFDLNWVWKEEEYIDLLRISGGLNRIIHYRNLSKKGITLDQCSDIQDRKSYHYKKLIKSGKIKLRIGVSRVIKELWENDVDQYVVTTSGRESLEPFLTNSFPDYKKYFSQIITFEDVKNHKPFPDAYKLALKLSNKSHLECLAIEDSEIGVQSAISANLKCLLTLPPWSSYGVKICQSANSCVDSLGSIEKPSKLIYGKSLNNRNVDYCYLNNIIN